MQPARPVNNNAQIASHARRHVGCWGLRGIEGHVGCWGMELNLNARLITRIHPSSVNAEEAE